MRTKIKMLKVKIKTLAQEKGLFAKKFARQKAVVPCKANSTTTCKPWSESKTVGVC